MSENNTFIAAKDLPEAEGDEISVMCIENGEMKQKSGASLSGEKTDLVIALNYPIYMNDGTDITVTIESGSIEALVEVLRSGIAPVVKCKLFHVYTDNGFDTDYPIAEGGVYDCYVLYYGGMIGFSFIAYGIMILIDTHIDEPENFNVSAKNIAFE